MVINFQVVKTQQISNIKSNLFLFLYKRNNPRMQKQKIEQSFQKKKPEYLHLFPFRAVLPYNHNYQTFAKSRWFEKPILETLVRQFKAYDQKYYQSAVEEGRITINGNKVAIDYLIKNGDKLSHSAIREEPPILDLEVKVIQDNQEYLVVNKPPSFTVHAGGGFHYNTLLSVLQLQMGYKDLFVLHRLDRLTSGLIILGKTKDKPEIFHKQNLNQQMKKMYYARVSGNFIWSEKTLSAQIQCLSHKDGIYKVTRQTQQKIHQEIKPKQNEEISQIKQSGIEAKEEDKIQGQIQLESNGKKQMKFLKKKQKKKEESNPDLKDSITHFKKVFYDQQTDSSLIECYPISGRTHQIRVHLQFLGFPILNDVVYGGRFVGNNIINLLRSNEKQRHIGISLNTTSQNKEELVENYGSKKIKTNQPEEAQLIKNTDEDQSGQKNSNQFVELLGDNPKNEQIERLKQKLQKEWDIKTKPWQICLHSYQYKLEGKVYQSQKPYWADINFKFNQ